MWAVVGLFDSCGARSRTADGSRMGSPQLALTDRAGRWATEQVGHHGRTVNAVALDSDWRTVTGTVVVYGAAFVHAIRPLGSKLKGAMAGQHHLGHLGPVGPVSQFDDMLPDAAQVADPFRLARLANSRLDECGWRVQNETLGYRRSESDPLSPPIPPIFSRGLNLSPNVRSRL